MTTAADRRARHPRRSPGGRRPAPLPAIRRRPTRARARRRRRAQSSNSPCSKPSPASTTTTLVGLLEEATVARLIVEVGALPPRHRFAHALVRATLYDDVPAARRAGFHRRVGEAIEAVHAVRLEDHVAALAHHWSRASLDPAETSRAIDYSIRAGDRSALQLANDEAMAYYRQALQLIDASADDDPRRLDLLISLGEAMRRAGDPAHRELLLDAARLAQRRGDIPQLARAALANTRLGIASALGEVDLERVAVLESAVDAFPSADSPLRGAAALSPRPGAQRDPGEPATQGPE